jgi:hypothetical protein
VRKPCSEKTVAANVLKHGCGGLNIDASRIGTDLIETGRAGRNSTAGGNYEAGMKPDQGGVVQGRFPANLLLSHTLFCEDTCTEDCPVRLLDEQSGNVRSAGAKSRTEQTSSNTHLKFMGKAIGIPGVNNYADSGGASRFFKCFSDNVEHAIESGCKTTPANNADQTLETTQAIEQIVSILFAPRNATLSFDLENPSHHAPTAENPVRNTETKLAQELVKTFSKKDRRLLHGLVSTLERKKQIQPLCLAITVALLENTGITLTIPNLKMLSGFASLVIENIITWVSEDQRLGSVPTRFRYIAKASKRERNAGLEGMPKVPTGSFDGNVDLDNARKIGAKPNQPNQNHHPTVKPQKLMQYLINLITPPNGIVLDPFMGSGSTGVAAKALGFGFIGIEREPEYFEIAEKRIG